MIIISNVVDKINFFATKIEMEAAGTHGDLGQNNKIVNENKINT